jgi:outer membrane lipoprotein-sorting protein
MCKVKGGTMKRAVLFITVVLALVLLGTAGCVSSGTDQQLVRIEAQVQTLTASLSSMQQEKVQEAAQTSTPTYTVTIPAPIYVVPNTYYPRYYPNYYYPPSPRPPYPPFRSETAY